MEDHPVVVKGLSQVINKQENLIFCGSTSEAKESFSLIKELNPDLVTVDLSLKDSNGLELIKDLVSQFPDIKILVISMFDENIYALRCIKAGAKGYIMKEKLTKELIKAINTVLHGKIYLSENMSEKVINQRLNEKDGADVIDLLSDRELEIFELIGEGLTTEEIADRLNISIKTVETYKSKIKDKLNLNNFTQLIKSAVEWNIKNKK
ncbi:MAG TPA: response regulator transcription factor [Spirochaetota bacterium]|nr:response regulator transcription factor [Spirochaetota bacterium]HOL57811.1 response regulator transcription factor [Spirochaetota bacterium]HPP04952.1 response regulator transcription factor [Spirochaetota bacterium]